MIAARGAPRPPQASCLRRLLLTLGILFALATAAAAAGPRAWEPVVVEGARLSALLGAPVNTIEVLAWRAGKPQPIPFQIDRAAAGAAAQCSSEENGAPLRAADELAIMTADFGDAANRATLPAGATAITVTDPLGGPARYAYVVAVKNPRRSPLSYVQYDAATERVETDFYRFGLRNGWPSDFTYQSYRFAHGPDLIERLTMSLSARVLGLFPYAMTERDLHISPPVVSCGPVRVVLRYRYAVSLIAGLRSPSITVPIEFYRQYIASPMAVRFPWLPRLFFRDTLVRINVDYGTMRPARLLWQGHDGGLAINAEARARQPAPVLDPGPSVNWMAVRQDGHLMIQAFPSSRDLDLIHHDLLYRGPADALSAAPATTRTVKIGYTISHLEELSAGRHVFEACFAVLDGSTDPATFFGALRAPLAVGVQSWPAAS